ncbi:MAG: hypothetical protein KGL74_05105 [Elusimicrobia bacterium]|nr:hypothetical protein [Elusimicrobiota bacterium]MDE2510480.1 hypothetical protein [Elusimicrobiota bacterium]
MITFLSAVFLASAAFAAPAPAVPASTATAVAPMLGFSTYTVSTLYTGDRVRDPFLPQSMGGPVRVREKGVPVVIDIHALQLRGIMKDGTSDFALFSNDDGTSLMLRGARLYDERGKAVPGITGHIRIKQKRAELMTADKDVQIYSLGETEDAKKDKTDQP